MKTLEITDEQYAFIQHLREEISESVVGKYGFVRERDAVQFLIDNLDEEIEIDADEFDSSATDDVTASVGAAIEGDDDPHELEAVSYVEDETPAPDDARDGEAADLDGEPDGSGAADSSGGDEAAAETDADTDAGADGADDGDDSVDEGDVADDGDGSADDDDMLDEMMSLLETHDDKWGESDSADYRYTVELPDGSSEQVQTKDDVRALLFKNYR
ncbi:hypothetical protein [Natrinema longum]|uniref:Uncharacterized protein n=1 Tax=Natrinema longum TaxID=370324 RepID=A0A8A2U8D4_9EURY|nr:hypothetical protein [Natrinema longum]MBZ6493738.1 hypothetical protein [Natrinema longum]QSW84924.1 hypothetical protein J0X27_15955 [Natrinema longum]